ncbi:hypothetical protein C3F00_034025, partial [Pseudomonas sp. MWU13-2860]
WERAVKVAAWSHVDDPYLFSRGLFDAFLVAGGAFERVEATALSERGGKVDGVVCADGRTLAAGNVIVTAGIWSDRFTRQCRYRVPLESERGYHVNLPKAGVALRHFIQCASESFVILPLADGGLRLLLHRLGIDVAIRRQPRAHLVAVILRRQHLHQIGQRPHPVGAAGALDLVQLPRPRLVAAEQREQPHLARLHRVARRRDLAQIGRADHGDIEHALGGAQRVVAVGRHAAGHAERLRRQANALAQPLVVFLFHTAARHRGVGHHYVHVAQVVHQVDDLTRLPAVASAAGILAGGGDIQRYAARRQRCRLVGGEG